MDENAKIFISEKSVFGAKLLQDWKTPFFIILVCSALHGLSNGIRHAQIKMRAKSQKEGRPKSARRLLQRFDKWRQNIGAKQKRGWALFPTILQRFMLFRILHKTTKLMQWWDFQKAQTTLFYTRQLLMNCQVSLTSELHLSLLLTLHHILLNLDLTCIHH